MSCDFKPGDELVAVKAADMDPFGTGLPSLVVGALYRCEEIFVSDVMCCDCPSMLAVVVNVPGRGGYCPCAFRKVQRKTSDLSIETFLTIKPGFEEPRRTTTPARKRERA